MLFRRILQNVGTGQQLKVADIGCCMGQDIRQLILDGLDPAGIFAIDLHDGYWNTGLELFNDSPIPSVSNRISNVNKRFCDMSLPANHPEALEILDENILHQFDFVIIQAVLHTMSRPMQEHTLARVLRMLKPHGGGRVMGTCVGSLNACEWHYTPDFSAKRFLNDESSLRELLVALGFKEISVKRRERDLMVNANNRKERDSLNIDDMKIYLEFSAAS